MKKIILTSLTHLLLGIPTYSVTTPCPLTDKGVLINGIRWATRNVNKPGTFADTPECSGMLFQWNRKKAWNAVDEEVEGWDNSIPTGTEWYAKNDPCPEGWRVPTREEIQSLNDAGSEWTTQNGVYGHLLGITPNQIFLPIAGFRFICGLLNAGDYGIYWSSTKRVEKVSSNELFVIDGDEWFTDIWSVDAWVLLFNNDYTEVSWNSIAVGRSIRCVQNKPNPSKTIKQQ
jgi:hypothetical protein